MNIHITRAYYNDCTLSRIRCGKFQCFGLELRWQGNEPEKSCIPEGDYPYRIAHSPSRKRDVIWLDNVEGRTNIQIHPGNYTRQILGCILPGDGIRDLDGDGIPDVTSSEVTFNKLIDAITLGGKVGKVYIRHAAMPVGVYK